MISFWTYAAALDRLNARELELMDVAIVERFFDQDKARCKRWIASNPGCTIYDLPSAATLWRDELARSQRIQ